MRIRVVKRPIGQHVGRPALPFRPPDSESRRVVCTVVEPWLTEVGAFAPAPARAMSVESGQL